MQQIKEAILSSKGQITVPKAIREILHVKNGESLVFYIENDEVKLTGTKNIDLKLKNNKQVTVIKGGKWNEKEWYNSNYW